MTDTPEQPAVVCGLCGVTAPSLPLGWSTSVEHGRPTQHCERCSRAHVRDLEAKLDSDWWA